jgi:hypothetical protein
VVIFFGDSVDWQANQSKHRWRSIRHTERVHSCSTIANQSHSSSPGEQPQELRLISRHGTSEAGQSTGWNLQVVVEWPMSAAHVTADSASKLGTKPAKAGCTEN